MFLNCSSLAISKTQFIWHRKWVEKNNAVIVDNIFSHVNCIFIDVADRIYRFAYSYVCCPTAKICKWTLCTAIFQIKLQNSTHIYQLQVLLSFSDIRSMMFTFKFSKRSVLTKKNFLHWIDYLTKRNKVEQKTRMTNHALRIVYETISTWKGFKLLERILNY